MKREHITLGQPLKNPKTNFETTTNDHKSKNVQLILDRRTYDGKVRYYMIIIDDSLRQ